MWWERACKRRINRSFAENRLIAAETIVSWKTIIMNATTRDCSRSPPLKTYVPLCNDSKQKSCGSATLGYTTF
jgi:hypothetical protein